MNDRISQDNEILRQRALHLAQVEKLSGKQIQKSLSMSYRKLRKLLEKDYLTSQVPQKSKTEPYRELIERWYAEYPYLKAVQIFDRLKEYGFKGSRSAIERFTKKHRQRKHKAYHPLVFLSGEEAQVDWFFFKTPKLGTLAGFVYLLSWSRYAWGRFYPRTTFEFFIQGHLDVFSHLKGIPRRHRYDNLKSVCLKRTPKIEYNANFFEFARHYGFSIHLCNPYSGNEKGRVERLIRDIRMWLYGTNPESLEELNDLFLQRMVERNRRTHRTTDQPPLHLLADEKLKMLPSNTYPARRILAAVVSKTCLVEFETNRYSVPSRCASKPCHITVYPERVEIHVDSKRVASHKRSFERKRMIQNPLHSERLLEKSPGFKMQRILELIQGMDTAFAQFLAGYKDPQDRTACAYEIFRLLRTHRRGLLISAVRELVRMKTFKIKALRSLLDLPSPRDEGVVRPHDERLLDIRYEERDLKDYDPS